MKTKIVKRNDRGSRKQEAGRKLKGLLTLALAVSFAIPPAPVWAANDRVTSTPGGTVIAAKPVQVNQRVPQSRARVINPVIKIVSSTAAVASAIVAAPAFPPGAPVQGNVRLSVTAQVTGLIPVPLPGATTRLFVQTKKTVSGTPSSLQGNLRCSVYNSTIFSTIPASEAFIMDASVTAVGQTRTYWYRIVIREGTGASTPIRQTGPWKSFSVTY